MNETTLSSRTVFQGRLLRVDVLEVALDGGGTAMREIVRHPGAAVVLARAPDGRFLFVRQFRQAAGRALLEAVAGTLEPGEAPEACARRELQEETSHEARELRALGAAYPAPGYTEELLHFYYARAVPVAGGPAPDADERLETVRLTAAEVEAAVVDGTIADAKTLVAWLWYTRKVQPHEEWTA